jgi:hypothetical protein
MAAAVLVADEDDGLDDASNRVIDLIDAGCLDDAEQAAQDLLARHPEEQDRLERIAMVPAARGDRPLAADYYREAADFVRSREGCDPEMEIDLQERATNSARRNEA